MKLFTRKGTVPQNRRPDYDFIAEVGREFKMDDAGFDERYDEMLYEHFKKDWSVEEWSDPTEIEDKLYELAGQLHSNRYQDLVYELITEVQGERSWTRDEDFKEECRYLRARMISRGKRRDD